MDKDIYVDRIPEFEERLQIARRSGDDYATAKSLTALAFIYAKPTKVADAQKAIGYLKAIEYLEEALDLFYKLQAWWEFYNGYRDLGFIYSLVKDDRKALIAYEFAIAHGPQSVSGDTEKKRNDILESIKLFRM